MSEMRLSEAIRLGAMLRPKANGWFFRDGRSCAQGAALEAAGIKLNDDLRGQFGHHADIRRLWPWTHKEFVGCPVCGIKTIVASAISHLNNTSGHDWPREAVADWVETIERRAGAEEARTEQETATPAVSFAQKLFQFAHDPKRWGGDSIQGQRRRL